MSPSSKQSISAQTIRLDEQDPAFHEDPHTTLDMLRAQDPVHQDNEFDRIVLTRVTDVAAVLADRSLSVDPFKARPTAYGRRGLTDADRANVSMFRLDDPDHARIRGLVAQAFTARAIDALRPRIEAIASDLLDNVEPQTPFDLIAAYAALLPCLVIGMMLGLAGSQVAQFRHWSDEIGLLFLPSRTEAEQQRLRAAFTELHEFFGREIVARREQPRGDLISALLKADLSGDQLSDTEISNNCRLLLVAGNLTTTDLIGNGAAALLRHPEELSRLQTQPELWPAAIEETLRFDPPVPILHRQCVGHRDISGCPVQAGQTISVSVMAANHDPAQHAEPHAFRIEREDLRHYSFGGGAHYCLGASLARLEAQVALSALFSRFSNLRFVPGYKLQRKDTPTFNGYKAIWLAAS